MWNSFPRQIHSVPLGGSCHKGLAAAQLTVQKQSQWLHWPSVPAERKKKTHWKIDNYCTMQLLRRLASSVSWEQSCLVFCEWYGGCVAIFSVGQHKPVPRVQLGLADILCSCSCIAVSSFLTLMVYGSPYHQTCHAFISFSGAIEKDKKAKMKPHTLEEHKANIRPQNCSNYIFIAAWGGHF